MSYKGTIVAFQRLDMVVDGRLIVETKATDELHEGARRQLYNYLRASDLKIGLLLHFGPRAKFYRMICRASRSDRIDPAFPSNPLIRISTPSRDDGASYRRPTNR